MADSGLEEVVFDVPGEEVVVLGFVCCGFVAVDGASVVTF